MALAGEEPSQVEIWDPTVAKRLMCLPQICNTSCGKLYKAKSTMSASSNRIIKILLVEDVALNRMVVRVLVNTLGLEMEEATNGQEALDYFSGGKTCDLVLMDKDMPIMDGHEATRQLRSLGVQTPIVALSAAGEEASYRDLFLQAGANEFLNKPLTKEKLVGVLARCGLD